MRKTETPFAGQRKHSHAPHKEDAREEIEMMNLGCGLAAADKRRNINSILQTDALRRTSGISAACFPSRDARQIDQPEEPAACCWPRNFLTVLILLLNKGQTVRHLPNAFRALIARKDIGLRTFSRNAVGGGRVNKKAPICINANPLLKTRQGDKTSKESRKEAKHAELLNVP